MREDKAGTSQVLAEGLARQNMTTDMLNVVMEIGNTEAIEMAVEAGIDLRRAIFMVRNTRQPLTHTQDRFWSYLKEHRQQFAADIWETVRQLAPP